MNGGVISIPLKLVFNLLYYREGGTTSTSPDLVPPETWEERPGAPDNTPLTQHQTSSSGVTLYKSIDTNRLLLRKRLPRQTQRRVDTVKPGDACREDRSPVDDNPRRQRHKSARLRGGATSPTPKGAGEGSEDDYPPSRFYRLISSSHFSMTSTSSS